MVSSKVYWQTMALLWEGMNYTLVNKKYKIRLNTTLQPSIKILNKCSCVSEDTKWVPSLLQFVAIWSSYSLKCVFLRKSRNALLYFPEPWFAFPTLVRTQATTSTPVNVPNEHMSRLWWVPVEYPRQITNFWTLTHWLTHWYTETLPW